MEDREIIDLYFVRSESAICKTAEKYGRMIKSVTYNILHNVSDSEECENDTYLAAWSQIPPCVPSCLGAYLGRIARNLALNRYSYYSAEKRNRGLEVALSELREIAGTYSADSAADAVQTGEIGGKISDFLRRQNRIKRIVFVRRYWYCDSIGEIAEKCGFSESKVKSMLMRIRRNLKSYLEKEGVKL